MSTDVLNQILQPGVAAVFGRGRQFLITSLTGTVNAVAKQLGSSSRQWPLNGIGAGFKFTTGDDSVYFDRLEVTSAGGDVIQIAVGDDDVNFANAVTVGNTVTTKALASSALSDIAPVVTGAAQAALVAQNLTRRRVTIFANPANAQWVYFRKSGGANDIGFVQPGGFVQFEATYGLDYRDPTGGGSTLYVLEES